MADCLYTLHWIDTGIIIQSGQVKNQDRYPPIPGGAMITEGIEGNPETERVEDGKLVPYDRPCEREELVGAIEYERARRLAAGFMYDFKDHRGEHIIGTTKADMAGWSEVTTAALKAVARGQGGKEIHIATNTGPVTVTASEWLDILDAAEEFRQPIFIASFALQEMDPIPRDADNPAYWP